MRERVGLYRLPGDKPMDRIADAIELVEQQGNLALEKFEALIGGVDSSCITVPFGNLELMVHAPAKPPNLLQLLGRHAEIGEERRLTGQFGRYCDADDGSTHKNCGTGSPFQSRHGSHSYGAHDMRRR